MRYDLKSARQKCGLTCKEMSEIIGLQEMFYKRHEETGEIPSKFVYKLWREYKNIPLPEDFWYFTSFSLAVNMKYHRMTQKMVAKELGYGAQATISHILSENIPLYEKKEEFLKAFNPLIIALKIEDYSDGIKPRKITELVARGNPMLAIKRKKAKEKRLALATGD